MIIALSRCSQRPFCRAFRDELWHVVFFFALAFYFIAVKWPKIANRPNKQPKETSVYKKFVRFMKDSKMKTLSVYVGLVHAHTNIFLLLFLFRIAFFHRDKSRH